jgi:hypothetical protein
LIASDSFLPCLVGAVDRRQRFENVGDGHHAGERTHLVARQPPWIAGAIHFFVVPGGDLGHVAQVLGEGKLAEHDQGLDDVLVDLVALFFGQRATGDAQGCRARPCCRAVRGPACGNPTGLSGRHAVLRPALEEMIGAVGQQGFGNQAVRWSGEAFLALFFFVRNADAVVEGARTQVRAAMARRTLLLLRCHEFAAFVAGGDESVIVIDLRAARRRGSSCAAVPRFAVGDGLAGWRFRHRA